MFLAARAYFAAPLWFSFLAAFSRPFFMLVILFVLFVLLNAGLSLQLFVGPAFSQPSLSSFRVSFVVESFWGVMASFGAARSLVFRSRMPNLHAPRVGSALSFVC